jgi:hypothetical protein
MDSVGSGGFTNNIIVMAAPKGNRYNERYSKEDALELFEKGLEYARWNEECLSVQDVVIYLDLSHSTFYNLCEQHKELDDIKKDLNDAIIARINRQALKNKFNPTASIWRMKQLGERDQQEIKHSGLTISTSEKSRKKIDELGDD